MKYICFKNQDDGKEEIIIFPRSIDHDCFAEVQSHIKNHSHGNWHRVRRTPVSAGFVIAIDGKLKCYGSSMTLGIKSRPEDTDILGNQLDD